jgi:hypothetical protein
MKVNEMNKISLKEVFINAKKVYKEQGKVLLKISAIQMMIIYAIILSLVAFNLLISQERLMLIFIATILMVLIVGFAIYFSTRMFVSLILASRSGFYGKTGSIVDFYKEAGPVTWRCIGYRFLLALIYALPIGFVAIEFGVSDMGSMEAIFETISTLLLHSIPLLALATLFYYVLTTAVVYRHPRSVFGYSGGLLSGNMLKIFVLVLISGFVWLFPVVYTSLLNVANYGFLGQAGLYLIEVLIMWLVTPFTTNLSVVSMQMIEAKNRENIEKENYAS